MPWAVAAAAVAAGASIYSSNKAAGAQQKASNSAIAEQQRQFDQTQANEKPYLNAGSNALGLQQAYLNGDTSGFENSPDYRFAVQQGTRQLDAGAAASGNLYGGGADADRIALGQGLATQYANNYWNKLQGQAQLGQASAGMLASAGQAAANNIGGYYTQAGQAQASGDIANGNSISNLANQFGQAYGMSQATGSSYGGGGGYMGGNGTGGLGMQTQAPSAVSSNFGYTNPYASWTG